MWYILSSERQATGQVAGLMQAARIISYFGHTTHVLYAVDTFK